MSQNKNYIKFVNDHSGSMVSIAKAAMKDYNANIDAVKSAATREMLDTVVSVVGVGIGDDGYGVKRQVVVSNPHVLKPITNWSTDGGTPLYDGIGNVLELCESLPDANEPHVSFLIMVTTDGDERHSRTKYRDPNVLAALIKKVTATGRYTLVFRVPRNADMYQIERLGISKDNIQKWDTTAAGMAESTVKTTAAMDGYFSARSAGAKSTTAFYADASKVDTSALVDITDKISLYVVPKAMEGSMIRDFILTKRMVYLKGAAFYQLTKTEARVQHTKLILIRDRTSGKFYGGKDARKMIGLPTDQNARLHPGDHKNFDLFIQSTSINRKLVGETGVAYWEEMGTAFTQEELDKFNGNAPVVAKPAVIQLPAVPVTNKPTKSPIPVTKVVQAAPTKQYFATRDLARLSGKKYYDEGSFAAKGKRWYVYN